MKTQAILTFLGVASALRHNKNLEPDAEYPVEYPVAEYPTDEYKPEEVFTLPYKTNYFV